MDELIKKTLNLKSFLTTFHCYTCMSCLYTTATLFPLLARLDTAIALKQYVKLV